MPFKSKAVKSRAFREIMKGLRFMRAHLLGQAETPRRSRAVPK